MQVHEDEAGRPAVLAGQFGERRQDARVAFHCEAVDGDHLYVVASDLGHNTGPHLLTADERIDVHRIAGQLDRVITPGDAELQPTQEVVLGGLPTVLGHQDVAAQALELHGGRQAGLNAGDITLESLDQSARAFCWILRGRVVMEHQLDKSALGEHRREIGQSQDEVAFVHRAETLEQAATFLVHGLGDRVAEMRRAAFRVARCRAAHSVYMQHPAIAQANQGLVDAQGNQVALLFGG